MKKKISLADIAKSLGVSRTLVSMVLNGQGDTHGISAATQKRVKAKAKELKYKPNPIARGLRTGKSNTIGLIVTDISNSFYAKIARKIEDKARQHGYNMIFCSSDENPEREEELIQMLRSRQVDGLIIATTFKDKQVLKELVKEEYPLVLIDRLVQGLEANFVGVDNYQSSVEAVDHLIRSGHERIGLLSITPTHLSSIRDRERGYKDALRNRKIRVRKKYLQDIPFDDIEGGINRALSELLEEKEAERVTALFATNNNLAKACLNYLNSQKIQIPKDIALLSYDDIDVFHFCNPPVTAIAQPIDRIGEEAVDILVDILKAKTKTTATERILPAQLMIRQSCGSTQPDNNL